MANPSQIPHLLKLLDDDSNQVQEAIMKELFSFGAHLQEEIQKQSLSLTEVQKKSLEKIFHELKKSKFKKDWPLWFDLEDSYARIEKAVSSVSNYLNPQEILLPFNVILDDLALQYKERFIFTDARLLAKFLFKEKGVKGNEEDYYNPQNSNMFYVLGHRQGIPLSLSVLFMLVGKRLGMNIEGCNFPGHFLTRVDIKGKYVFIDCFSSGQFVEATDILKTRKDGGEGLEHILYEDVDAETIIRRYLINLIRAYEIKAKLLDKADSKKEFYAQERLLIIDLLKELDAYQTDLKLARLSPDEIISDQQLTFKPGDLIKHCKYAYRGVVVSVDECCKASDEWYYGSSIQPERYQPWLHILVDGTDQVTYVGESELIEEEKKSSVSHPLLTYFFKTSPAGQYIRNDNPWPATDF